MKIVHVTQYFHPEKGYQENSLAIEQIKLGHRVTIICSDDLTLWAENKKQKEAILFKDKFFSERTNIQIIRIRAILKISGRIFSTGLKKEIKHEKPDILFLHGVYLPYTIVGLLSLGKKTFKKNVHVIVDDHMVAGGSFNKYSSILYSLFKPFFRIFLKLSGAKISKWVAVSNETKNFMIKNYGISENIEILPLGFNEKICYYDPEGSENWRKENNLPSGLKYVLYIGKCDHYKNPIDLFATFKKFAESNSNFALLIVGEMNKEYRSVLMEKATYLNIVEKIFIRPAVNNLEIRKVLSLARMVIWPHGSSMTMLEAMACNCPVIASNMDVNLERLGDSRGLLFNNINEELLHQMIKIEHQRENIIFNAKEWVSKYSWESINKNFLENLN